MPVPIPSPEEQRAIAQFLDAVDDTIRKTEAYVDQLRATKHQIMRELLTLGHPDFRTEMKLLKEPWRIGRVAPTVESIPKHWELVTLSEVARLESGHTPSRKHPEYWNGDICWISLQDAHRFGATRITATDQTIGPLGIQNSSARVLPENTIVLVRTGASLGKCTLLGAPMATSQGFANYVCGPHLAPSYLLQVFRHMQREWQRLEAGSAIRDIYMPVFKRLKVLLPPADEQAAIAGVGEAFDKRVIDETQVLDQLRDVKRGLAQALLTGRVRVPTVGSGDGARGGP